VECKGALINNNTITIFRLISQPWVFSCPSLERI
jgi:hypothetical protein